MEFWGIEVEPGNPFKVEVEDGKVIHISQASLGEIQKDKPIESVPIHVNINGKKIALGHISRSEPSQCFDLVFEKDFELSHNSKNGSVYFTGYTSEMENAEGFSDFDDSGSEDEPLAIAAENGKPEPKAAPSKAVAPVKAIAKKPEPKKDSKAMDVDDDDSDEVDSDDSDDEADMDGDDSEDEDESDEDEDEETPKKAEVVGKKRAPESATKTPVPAKKAKAATPQKTDGKKGGHTATPHPAKKGGKTPATPKSAGQFSCSPCNRTFGSETGLQSHNKAKHSAK